MRVYDRAPAGQRDSPDQTKAIANITATASMAYSIMVKPRFFDIVPQNFCSMKRQIQVRRQRAEPQAGIAHGDAHRQFGGKAPKLLAGHQDEVCVVGPERFSQRRTSEIEAAVSIMQQ